MKHYINDQGLVIQAMQWDGSDEGMEKIKTEFPLLFFAGTGDYIFIDPVINKPMTLSETDFEKKFKPITDERVLLIKQFSADMLTKLSTKQHKGSWKSYSLGKCLDLLGEEGSELMEAYSRLARTLRDMGYAVDQTELIEEAKLECCDVSNSAAIMWDKLRLLKEGNKEWKEAEKAAE